jgi:hypothetical protein
VKASGSKMKSPLSTPRKKTGKNTEGWPPSQWRTFIWYMILMLATLWIWQEAGQQVAYQTIPYSQFKDYVQHGEVVQCSVKETEIEGTIRPHPAATSQGAPPAAKPETPATSPASEEPAKPSAEKAPGAWTIPTWCVTCKKQA